MVAVHQLAKIVIAGNENPAFFDRLGEDRLVVRGRRNDGDADDVMTTG